MTQKDRVLRHLQDYGSITTWEAIQDYGITRLSQMILLLRQQGLNVQDEWLSAKNRYGEQARFKKYILERV